MKRLTLNFEQVKVMSGLLEVQIETYVDMYGTKDTLLEEGVYQELEVWVNLHSQLGGQIDTKLLKEGYNIVYGIGWEG